MRVEPLGDWVTVCPWRSRRVLFVLDSSAGIEQANSIADKRRLLARENGTLTVFWPGEWSSTARQILPGGERFAVLHALDN